MEVTLPENDLRELDMVYLSIPLPCGMPGATGAHISRVIPFQGVGEKGDKEMAQSPKPFSRSMVVHPHSAISESSIQLLGTGWTRSQLGQLQLLPNPLPAVQIDRALFVMGDMRVAPQVDMSPVRRSECSISMLQLF